MSSSIGCGAATTSQCARRALWRLLYETAARAQEVLSLNVEDLDLENKRARARSKGGDIEWLHLQSGSARLLPRLIAGRPADRCSSPTAAPHQHAPPPQPTSAHTPAAVGCPTAAPRSCSQLPRAGGRYIHYATPRSRTSPKKKSACRC